MSVEAALGTTFGTTALLTAAITIILWKHSKLSGGVILLGGVLPLIAFISDLQGWLLPRLLQSICYFCSPFVLFTGGFYVAIHKPITGGRGVVFYVLISIAFLISAVSALMTWGLMNLGT